MSALSRAGAAPASPSLTRPILAGAGFLAAAAVWFLARRVAPDAPRPLEAALALIPLISFAALAALLEEGALARYLQAAIVGAALTFGGAFIADADTRALYFGLAMAMLMGGLVYALARSGKRPLRPSRATLALFAAAAAVFSAYGAYLVIVSRDLEIADFMNYRNQSIAVATMLDGRRFALLIATIVGSVRQDYSWFPAVVPGAVMALSAPLSRAVYTGCLILFYATPAYLALSLLARDLARRAVPPLPAGRGEGRGEGSSPQARSSAPFSSPAAVALTIAAAFAAYPAGLAVAARGMPDVGGLALVVVALRLADTLARLLALAPGHDAKIGAMIRRVALALALALFAMFVFRRWYAFAAAGIVATLAAETGLVALRRGRAFRWRDALCAAAVAAPALLAMASPIVVDWLPNLGAHDYASIYAAYRKPADIVVGELANWIGLIPILLALAGAAFLALRSRDRRLLRLTLGSAAIAALMFLRVQTPYVHHLYLIAPALTAVIAAPAALIFARAPRIALVGVAALAGLTVSPAAHVLARFGLTPTAGLPAPPRPDLDELLRLKQWVDARARPDHRVCGLGSSYTFSGQIINELWQLEAKHSPLPPSPAERVDVKMSDVDSVEGPPVAGLEDCAVMIVGEPVQTHLNPDYQQTVIIPSREMLAGQGIGAKYRRTGEVFHLDKDVSAVVFERIAPLDDSDIAALQARWRAARTALGFGDQGKR